MTVIIISFVLTAVLSYLLGSVNFSIIFTKKFAGTDVRTHGSGNAGATNVLRTAGKLPAALTFACDFLKTVAAILIATLVAYIFKIDVFWLQFLKYTAGIGCLFGHIFPVYFGFKGGKGVTTFAAVVLMLDWRCFLICISIFVLVVLVSRMVSLGSVIAVGSVPVVTFLLEYFANNRFALADALLSVVIASVIIFKHRANIVRIIHGKEAKLGSHK